MARTFDGDKGEGAIETNESMSKDRVVKFSREMMRSEKRGERAEQRVEEITREERTRQDRTRQDRVGLDNRHRRLDGVKGIGYSRKVRWLGRP